MSVKILFTGNSQAGSWKIRGEQLAAAVGGTAISRATREQISMFDVVVYVKRPSVEIINSIQISRCKFVWDVVDSWPQPEGNGWDEERAKKWLNDCVHTMQPHAVVCATKAMQKHLSSGVRSIALPHHAYPDIGINPIRDEVKTVGYFGRAEYLANWDRSIRAVCLSRKWEFLVNPPRMDMVDIGIALRGGKWKGFATDHWKSNVKLANFQASGTPCILAVESGYMETATGAEYFVRTDKELRMAFDWLTPKENRLEVHKRLLNHGVDIKPIAENYKKFLLDIAA